MSTHLAELRALNGGPLDVTACAIEGGRAIQLTPATGYVQLRPAEAFQLAHTILLWLEDKYPAGGVTLEYALNRTDVEDAT